MDFFLESLLIPILANLSRTYSAVREDLILALQKHLSQDFSFNFVLNKKLQYLIMVVSCQYIIETENIDNQSENRNLIKKWIKQKQKLFAALYGKIDYTGPCAEIESCNNLYNSYLNNLCEQKLLHITAYYIVEKEFILKRCFLPIKNLWQQYDKYRADYNSIDIIFSDIY